MKFERMIPMSYICGIIRKTTDDEFLKTKHCFSYGRVMKRCKRQHHSEVYRIMRLINTRFLRYDTRSKIKDMSRVWGIFCSPLNNGWFYIIEIFSLNVFVVLQLLA